MRDIRDIIAKNVKELRHKKGISQAELAYRADLHYNYIGRIENSKCNISVITLEKLSKAFGVSISDLLR